MGVTPVYGITYPDSNTKAVNLGAELRNMGLSIENALKQGGSAAPVDTGWIPVTTFLNGFSARPGVGVFYRRLGPVMWMSGQLYNSTAPTAGVVAFNLPTNYVPRFTSFISTIAQWGAYNQIATDGSFSITATLARSSGQGFPLDGMSWLIGTA